MIMVGIRVRVRFGKGKLSAMVVFFGRGANPVGGKCPVGTNVLHLFVARN